MTSRSGWAVRRGAGTGAALASVTPVNHRVRGPRCRELESRKPGFPAGSVLRGAHGGAGACGAGVWGCGLRASCAFSSLPTPVQRGRAGNPQTRHAARRGHDVTPSLSRRLWSAHPVKTGEGVLLASAGRPTVLRAPHPARTSALFRSVSPRGASRTSALLLVRRVRGTEGRRGRLEGSRESITYAGIDPSVSIYLSVHQSSIYIATYVSIFLLSIYLAACT